MPWKRITIVGIIVAELIALSAIAFLMRSAPTDGVAARPSEATLTVTSQDSVSSVVRIEHVVAPGPSWIVLQAESASGTPGAVFGSIYVEAGESTNLGVPVQPGTLPRLAVATLVADLGNRAQLEYDGTQMASTGAMGGSSGQASGADKPYVAHGMPVAVGFRITPLSFRVASAEATIAAASRDATGTRVFATGVVTPGPSWLSVSVVSTGGVPGSVLAYAPVQAGVTPTVTVTLLSAMDTQPLAVTLHADLGRSGQFDYTSADASGSPDQPYVAGGRTVRILIPPAR